MLNQNPAPWLRVLPATFGDVLMIWYCSGDPDRALYGVHDVRAGVRRNVVWDDDEQVVITVLVGKACSPGTEQDDSGI